MNAKQAAAEIFRTKLRYDPDTGAFSWVGPRPGRPGCGSVDRGGYLRIAAYGKRFMAHHIAWLLIHGEWPTTELDHINGKRLDNRIANLRPASVGENRRNRPMMPSNRAGLKGAHFVKSTGRWRAQIATDGKKQYLGTFATAEEAHEAYRIAAARLHGDFARLK